MSDELYIPIPLTITETMVCMPKVQHEELQAKLRRVAAERDSLAEKVRDHGGQTIVRAQERLDLVLYLDLVRKERDDLLAKLRRAVEAILESDTMQFGQMCKCRVCNRLRAVVAENAGLVAEIEADKAVNRGMEAMGFQRVNREVKEVGK